MGRKTMQVRVRFAPSPTGHLHIGGARTALFNWLYARQSGGRLILRIEDTDLDRSSSEMADRILEGMEWLGTLWDEGPYYQSQRLDLYQSVTKKLLEEGKAYRCFCSLDELEQKKQATVEAGETWRYDGTCRELSQPEIDSRLDQGDSHVVRFKVPTLDRIKFRDLVFRTIKVRGDHVDDFVLLRSDGMPTYHLSVVADDSDMGITHVIRGQDHLLNTAKHILLHQALGNEAPAFAHLPLILGPDRKRLSKRHGASSLLEFRDQGFVPEALRNYLALLGWSPGNNQEVLGSEELIQRFSLERINKANAVFDPKKLQWMNGQYMRSLAVEELEPRVRHFLVGEQVWDPAWESTSRDWFVQLLKLLQSRAQRLTDFSELGKPFLSDQVEYEAEAVEKHLSPTDPEARTLLHRALKDLQEAYAQATPFDLETTEQVLRSLTEQHQIATGAFIGAVRVALTGRAASPGIFEVIDILGQKKTVERLQQALRFLE